MAGLLQKQTQYVICGGKEIIFQTTRNSTLAFTGRLMRLKYQKLKQT